EKDISKQNILECETSLTIPQDSLSGNKPKKKEVYLGGSDVSLKSANDVAIIDLMVVYTPAALNFIGSTSNMNNTIATFLTESQLVLDNSDTGVILNLVHSQLITYTESGDSTLDLERLTFPGDGYMDEVHNLRNTYNADLVKLITLTEDTGGIAWILNTSGGSPEYGFSLSRIQQATGTSYTPIHEIGHNSGCGHHAEQNVQPGPGLFSYSSGWRWTNNNNGKDCSIMAYESGQYYNDGTTHFRKPYFSNPDVFHKIGR